MKPISPQSFHGLMATTYDLFFQTSQEEHHFYRHFLEAMPGPSLELGCGTGQLLVTYVREGFDVHGVDSSSRMLEICALQGKRYNLQPKLYHQTFEKLCLPESYTTLYIPSCSFMLITDIQNARDALSQFYNQLAPGGQLLISLFNPWLLRSDEHQVFRLQGDVITETNNRILLYQAFSYNYFEQIRHGCYRFETYVQEYLEKVELYDFWWRWYGRYEFEMMLEQAGFSDISLYSDFTLERPTSMTETVIFRAQKPLL